MPETDDLELLPLPDPSRLPVGFQRIHVKPLLAKDREERMLVTNDKYRSREGAAGSSKPISKIVK